MRSWEDYIREEREKPYCKEVLKPFLEREYLSGTVYPAKEDIFRALELTPLDRVKAVILGQDPYHEPGQAHGLAFSVPDGVEIPPSLKNIYAEIDAEYGCGIPESDGKGQKVTISQRPFAFIPSVVYTDAESYQLMGSGPVCATK